MLSLGTTVRFSRSVRTLFWHSVFALLVSAVAAPSWADSPYPILLVHGINSSHEMWGDPATISEPAVEDRDPVAEIALRFGLTAAEIAPDPLYACLNLDGNPEINNLDVLDLYGDFPPPPTAADIGLWFRPTSGDYRIWRMDFRLGSDLSDSDTHSDYWILDSAIEPNPNPGASRFSFRVALGAKRDELHVGQYLATVPVGCATGICGAELLDDFEYYRIVEFDEDPTYNTTLELLPGQIDPGDCPACWFTALVNLSHEEAIVKQALVIGRAIQFIQATTGSQRVIVIAHSMGGLAARAYLQWGRSSQSDPGTFWPSDEVPGGHGIAKLLTLGTPHGGSNAAEWYPSLWPDIHPRSNASRDLAYDFNGGSYAPDLVPTDAEPGILILGGNESTVPLADFESQDIDCETTTSVEGLDASNDAQLANPALPLPNDLSCFWLTGLWFEDPTGDRDGDGAVRIDRQLLFFTGETKNVHACHASSLLCCTEARSYDALVEGLDEGDTISTAWPIALNRPFRGFITHQGDLGGPLDLDVYEFEATGAGTASVRLSDIPGSPVSDAQLRLLDASGSEIASVSGGDPLEIIHEFATGTAQKYFVEVSGSAPGSDPGFGFLRSACDQDDTNCPNCSDPYTLVVNSDVGPSTLTLQADPASVGPGQLTRLSATVLTPSGNPVPAGSSVELSTAYPGTFSGCSGSASSCTESTDSQGQVSVGFSSSLNGSATIFATAESGGSDSVVVTIAQSTSLASADPNPVAVDLPSTLSVTILKGDGSPSPPGQVVTFSTTHPGFFTGNGASSTTSPSSVLTDANGETWIWFASSVVGTALITIESGDASPITLPLEILNPNADLNISQSVGFVGGDDGSSQYEVEAVVTNTSGAPIPGERVEFTTSRGNLSVDHNFTGTTGIADTHLSVTSSGDVTVTANAGNESVATTFFAQVGSPPNAQMFPVRTFTLADEIMGISYTPAGDALIAGDYSGNVTAWNTADWSLRWTATTADDRASEVSVSPDGTYVLQAHDDGVDIFNVANGSLVCSVTNPDSKGINGTFTSNSSYFDSSFPHGFRHTSLCSSGSTFFTMPGSDDFDRRSRMGYTPQRGLVAAGSAEGNVYVWNTSGSLVRTEILTSGRNDGGDVAFSSTGGSLAAVGWRTAKIYNTTSWSSSSYTPQQLGDDLWGVSFLDNDDKFAIGGVGKVEVLSVTGGSSFRVGDVSGSAWEMSWSPQRQELAVGTSGRKVYIFKPLDPVDSQPPIINISHPPEGFVTNEAALTTTGRVTDATGVASFTINGTAVTLDASGDFSHGITLAPGANTLSYSATDLAGNTATTSRSVTLLVDNTPPVISSVIVLPSSGQAGQVFGLSATVVDGDAGVASVVCTLKDGGGTTVGAFPLTDNGGDSYSVNIDSTALAIGFYTIDVVAVDSSAQANTRTATNAAGFEIEAPPSMAISPESLDFGSLEVGSSADGVFIVTNNGGGLLTGTASTGAPFSVVSGSPYTLGHQQSATVTVRFTPTAEGAAAETVVFSGSGGAALDVSGIAFVVPCEDFALTDATVTSTVSYEACGILSAGPAVQVVAPGFLTLKGRQVVLYDGFSVAAGARLQIDTTP